MQKDTKNSTFELDLFFEKYLEHPPIINRHEILLHSYLPDTYPHRNLQIQGIGEILANILKGNKPSNMFLYGKPGTGKTSIVKFVLKKLNEHIMSNENKFKIKFEFYYINCKDSGNTNYSVYQNLTQSIDENQIIPATGLPTSTVFQRLIQSLNNLGNKIIIIILDEIDELVKKSGSEVIYSLTRINDSLSDTKVSLIGISNDTKFKDYLDPRAFSSLSEEELVFSPYNAVELIDILRERAFEALHPGVLNDGVIQKIAAIAAREHGDARRAIDLLRVSAEITERQGLDKVTINLVNDAKNHIEKNTVQEVLSTLPFQSKIVIAAIYQLEIIDKVKDISTGLVYQQYIEICNKLYSDPLSSRRISDYINELDILGIIEANVISRGRYGRTKKLKLCIHKSTIVDAFSNSEENFRNLFFY